jgi:hypothetical protein
MEVLLTGTDFIIGHPERALATVFIFLGLGFLSRLLGAPAASSRVLWVPATAWALFSAMEWEANREGAYIRLDLLITWPGIWLITLVSAVFWFYRWTAFVAGKRR